jgi:hypothetical protein
MNAKAYIQKKLYCPIFLAEGKNNRNPILKTAFTIITKNKYLLGIKTICI